jgi:GMP synthase (glutamine-hydrolysing)
MATHEHNCFVRTLGVSPESVAIHSLLAGAPSEAVLAETDALLVGGSGDYSVLGDEPFIRTFLNFLADVVVGRSFPTFASCFGFQGLVLAGGGDVICDKEGAEVGTFKLHLTNVGRTDPLMAEVGESFFAQLGHKDRAERLPSGMLNLAYSENTPYQALRIEGAPVFATQFHPELTREDNAMRYQTYWASYGTHIQKEDPVLSSLRESPETSALLPRWASTLG